MSSGLRESLDVLDSMIADGESAGFGTRYDAEILAALKELQARRRGEYLCPRCRMREEGEQPEVAF
jgi:ribosomal protein L37AE/L43A